LIVSPYYPFLWDCVSFSAYFTHPEPSYNIIGIDWAPLANGLNYLIAAPNAVRVGKYAGDFLGELLITKLGQSPKQVFL
jgi:hypothetical protein